MSSTLSRLDCFERLVFELIRNCVKMDIPLSTLHHAIDAAIISSRNDGIYSTKQITDALDITERTFYQKQSKLYAENVDPLAEIRARRGLNYHELILELVRGEWLSLEEILNQLEVSITLKDLKNHVLLMIKKKLISVNDKQPPEYTAIANIYDYEDAISPEQKYARATRAQIIMENIIDPFSITFKTSLSMKGVEFIRQQMCPTNKDWAPRQLMESRFVESYNRSKFNSYDTCGAVIAFSYDAQSASAVSHSNRCWYHSSHGEDNFIIMPTRARLDEKACHDFFEFDRSRISTDIKIMLEEAKSMSHGNCVPCQISAVYAHIPQGASV